MGVQTVIVGLIVAAAAAYAGRWIYRSLKPKGKGGGCGCGKTACGIPLKPPAGRGGSEPRK